MIVENWMFLVGGVLLGVMVTMGVGILLTLKAGKAKAANAPHRSVVASIAMSGSGLFVCGDFVIEDVIHGAPKRCALARWNGTTWEPML